MQENFQIPPPPITCSPQMDQPMEIGNSYLLFANLKMFLTIVSSQWFPHLGSLWFINLKVLEAWRPKCLLRTLKESKEVRKYLTRTFGLNAMLAWEVCGQNANRPKCQPDIMPTKGWHFVRPNFLVGILSGPSKHVLAFCRIKSIAKELQQIKSGVRVKLLLGKWAVAQQLDTRVSQKN